MIKYLFVILLLNQTCSSTKKIDDRLVGENVINKDWQVINKSAEVNNQVYLKIKNISGLELDVLNPLERKISKKIGEDWVRVKYPYCPCGRSCPNPPDMFRIAQNGEFELEWDKTSINCDGTKLEKSPEENGLYRFTILYRIPNIGVQEFIYQFSI